MSTTPARPGSSQYLGLGVDPSEVLDPQKWRERYAWGIQLGGGGQVRDRSSLYQRLEAAKCGGGSSTLEEVTAGESAYARLLEEIPDEVIRWHLRAAMSEAEYKLGMPMGVNVVKADPVDDGLQLGVHYDEKIQRLPYTHGEARDWFRIDLPRRGIISVERIRAYYYGTKVWDVGPSTETENLIRLEWDNTGVLHILPINLQAVLTTQAGNYGFWHAVRLSRSPVPDVWAVDFTYGPITRDKQVGKIPAVLAHWISCAAGILLLSQAGLAQSKGLTSSSVSIDGVSRSIGLQASAIFGLNSALEHAYDEAMKRIDWKRLRAQMRGLRVRKYSH